MLGLEGKLSDERQQNGGQLPEGIAIGDGLDLPILCHHVLNLLQLLHGSQENFFAATFSTASPFLRSLSNTFLASSTLPTCTSHLENSSRKVLIKDLRPHIRG